jgi:hypothetical protein
LPSKTELLTNPDVCPTGCFGTRFLGCWVAQATCVSATHRRLNPDHDDRDDIRLKRSNLASPARMEKRHEKMVKCAHLRERLNATMRHYDVAQCNTLVSGRSDERRSLNGARAFEPLQTNSGCSHLWLIHDVQTRRCATSRAPREAKLAVPKEMAGRAHHNETLHLIAEYEATKLTREAVKATGPPISEEAAPLRF